MGGCSRYSSKNGADEKVNKHMIPPPKKLYTANHPFSGQWTKVWFTILFVCVFFPQGIGLCSTYYISSSSGKDSNSGTSSQTPWKTLNKLEKVTMHPGDSILLKRGDIWNESFIISNSGTKDKPILISAYAEGAMPVLNGATLLDKWTLNADGIYTAKYHGTCNGLLEDGRPIKRALSPGLKDGQWYFDGSFIFYKPAIGKASAHQVERCARGALITIKDTEHVIIDGIVFYGANSFGIRLIDCSYIVIRNCRVTCNGQDGISIQRMRAELNCKSIIIHKNIVEWNANGIYITGKDDGFKSDGYSDCEIKNNTVTHTNYQNVWGHSTKDGHALGIQNSSFCRFEGNTITDNYSGIALWTAANYESHNNIFTRNYIARSLLYGIVHGADGANNSFHNTFSFNIIIDCGHSAGHWGGLRINRSQSKGNKYYNNTLYNNDINIYLYSLPDYHVIKNNISMSPQKYHVWVDDSAGTHNVIDNNCYYSIRNNFFHFRSPQNLPFAAWQKKSQQDASSILTDPFLKSSAPVSENDFRLSENSPCRGRARNTGFDMGKDFFGNKCNDIGASGFMTGTKQSSPVTIDHVR